MPADPVGTTPGLVAPSDPPLPEVNMPCRREGCISKAAYVVTRPDLPPSVRQYRCIQCNHTWGLNVGGFLDV